MTCAITLMMLIKFMQLLLPLLVQLIVILLPAPCIRSLGCVREPRVFLVLVSWRRFLQHLSACSCCVRSCERQEHDAWMGFRNRYCGMFLSVLKKNIPPHIRSRIDSRAGKTRQFLPDRFVAACSVHTY